MPFGTETPRPVSACGSAQSSCFHVFLAELPGEKLSYIMIFVLPPYYKEVEHHSTRSSCILEAWRWKLQPTLSPLAYPTTKPKQREAICASAVFAMLFGWIHGIVPGTSTSISQETCWQLKCCGQSLFFTLMDCHKSTRIARLWELQFIAWAGDLHTSSTISACAPHKTTLTRNITLEKQVDGSIHSQITNSFQNKPYLTGSVSRSEQKYESAYRRQKKSLHSRESWISAVKVNLSRGNRCMWHALSHVAQAVQTIAVEFAYTDETQHVSTIEHLGIGMLTVLMCVKILAVVFFPAEPRIHFEQPLWACIVNQSPLSRLRWSFQDWSPLSCT